MDEYVGLIISVLIYMSSVGIGRHIIKHSDYGSLYSGLVEWFNTLLELELPSSRLVLEMLTILLNYIY